MMPSFRRPSPSTRRAASREDGQVLVIFAVAIGVLVLLAGLMIDGALLFQSRADLAVIARHAASDAAQMVDLEAYNANCTGKFGGVTDPACIVPLDGAKATTEATRVARGWAAESAKNFMGMPTKGQPIVVVTGDFASGVITVEVTRCYVPYLVGLYTNARSGPCAGSTAVTESATATTSNGR